ncbi:hypothetical protein [Altericista sp. CCNU0014]|uniref:hypothetical protein n=1 Tax=Altericista sp. CCNU0014 TaxID=3082949 RepID=UPI00384EB90F
MATAQILEKQLSQPIDFSRITPEQDIGKLNLREACQRFAIDKQGDIPLWVWLLENPDSPIALPGSIDLHGHDCIHLLLNRGVTAYDEAFVIGFTMGNADKVEPRHISIIKVFSRFVYPKLFRFNPLHLHVFDCGVKYGQRVKYRNIHKEVFDRYEDWTIEEMRQKFGISLRDLHITWMAEQILFVN